jgi:hypothetical protein
MQLKNNIGHVRNKVDGLMEDLHGICTQISMVSVDQQALQETDRQS